MSMNRNDCRDWFIMILIAIIWIASTVFIFKYPDKINFATWAGIVATMTSAYHWFNLKDSKVQDA